MTVDDPQALRALSHPLRLELLALLRLEGPSTATALGTRLGQSSGATSYHLRVLARHGFVGDAEGLGNGRERWWRALQRTTTWEPADVGEDVAREMHLRLVEQRGRLLSAWLRQGPTQAEASLNDDVLRLTPEEARRLAGTLTDVLQDWADRHRPDQTHDGELVAVVVDLLPLREWPL